MAEMRELTTTSTNGKGNSIVTRDLNARDVVSVKSLELEQQ